MHYVIERKLNYRRVRINTNIYTNILTQKFPKLQYAQFAKPHTMKPQLSEHLITRTLCLRLGMHAYVNKQTQLTKFYTIQMF